ncbi:MAG: ASCH domain-containing protein [Archaeoglobales archaeon]|nr:MAG: ASCH domain-containing protein [Archaeoglobales archaeon]
MKHLEFKEKYLKSLLSGKKRATIRATTNLKPGDTVFVHCGGKIIGKAEIESIEEKLVEELTEEDARADGFSDLKELRRELRRLYGDVNNKFYVIRFRLEPFENAVLPHEMYYGSAEADLLEIAKKALEKLNLSKEEKRILEIFINCGSIKKAALKLGGIRKRKVVREVLRKCSSELCSKKENSTERSS